MDKRPRLYDVTMWMEDFVFPGNQPVRVDGPHNALSGSNPEYVYDIAFPTQAGTHVQGPHYFMAEGDRVNDLPLDRFHVRAHILDVTKRGEDITAEDLAGMIDAVDMVGDAVVLRTGHMDELVDGAPLRSETRPGLSLLAARYLVEERGVSMIAIDSVGVESRQSCNYEVNVYLCEQGII
ncbi:MAG: cyclase family protein, partial [Clostridia bacterium]